jgi:type II secretory pathway predicted ATPase ExeA
MSPFPDRESSSPVRPLVIDGGARPLRAVQAWLNEAPQLEAFARLHYLLARSFGCGLLTGPDHCGKSVILRAFRSQLLRTPATVLHADGAGLDPETLMQQLAAGCGLPVSLKCPPHALRQDVLDSLQGLLEAGRHVVFLLDHADAMSTECVHAFCRMLHTAETAGHVTAIWSARRPLAPLLRETLLPMTELRIEVSPLSEAETDEYVLQASGRPAGTFDAAAVAAIHQHSAGRLRRVDHLCELALMAAHADEQATISRELIDAVALELA